MKNEREDKLNVQLSASDGIPKVSFTSSDGNDHHLKGEDYHIAGNEFTAYYDPAHKLIFVVDRTLDERKPNVLLVINPVGDRKWDDILANDYDVDLETVRPKVDNKYQKLDIDYQGLSVYNNLINEYNAGRDLDAALVQMSNFRDESVRRSAMERLTAAEESMDKTRDTITKTNETIAEMQAKLQALRKKLTRQKKEVGKEPTKQSAAKILKTESQIDAANDKIKRSKKRLQNAQRRMLVAENDAEIARKILEQRPLEIQTTTLKAEPSKDIIMAEEEVKPLFEKDPEILDETIAFKPIDFSTPSKPVTENITVRQTAPVMTESADPVLDSLHSTQSEIIEPIPMESIFSTSSESVPVSDIPAAEALSFTPPVMTEEIREEESFAAPKPTFTPEPIVTPDEIVVTAPVVEPEPTIFEESPVVNQVEPLQQSNPTPIPEPIAEDIRPVSPITGTSGTTISGGSTRAKPSPLYYIMLVVLIVLSVLTLWLYQKNSGDTVPELVATDVVEQRVMPTPTPVPAPPVVESPFIQVESVVEEPAPVPVVQPEPEIIQPVVEEAPVFVEPEPEVFIEEPVPVEEPITIEETDSYYDSEPVYNVIEEPVPVEQPAQPDISEPVVNKPAYGVSSDRTFVADENYETDRLSDGTYYDDVYYDDEEYYY